MRDHERRELQVIEEELRAQAPELAALFDPPATSRGPRPRLVLAAGLLLLGLLLGDPTASLGALALLAGWAVPWTVDAPRRRAAGPEA